jgi:hypothetical protein
MPTRIVREGILSSEQVNSLSERAELFYRRLMSVADDHGRYFANAATLRGTCYPLRTETVGEADVKQFLAECISAGLITLYGGGKYLIIHKFGQQTRSKSKFPEPTQNELLIKCQANENQMSSLVGGGGVVGCEGVSASGLGLESNSTVVELQHQGLLKNGCKNTIGQGEKCYKHATSNASSMDAYEQIKTQLFAYYRRKPGTPSSYAEQSALAEIARRPNCLVECQKLLEFAKTKDSYFPQSLSALLSKWQETIDRSKMKRASMSNAGGPL